MKNKKEIWFANIASHIINNRWKYLLLTIAIIIVSAVGLPRIQLDSSLENWFTKDSKQLFNSKQFEQNFGNTDVVGIHLQADDVLAAKNLYMLRKLTTELEEKVSHVDRVQSIINLEYTYARDSEIITEPLLADNPTEEDIGLTRQRVLAKPYLKNNFVSDDFTETWVIIELLPYTKNADSNTKLTPEYTVGKEILDVLNQSKYKAYNLRPVGAPLYNYEELVFTNAESGKLIILTLMVLIIFLALFYRSLKKVVIPMLTTVVSIFMVFGTMGYLGIKINAILFAVPIIFSLSVSLGFSIHLINYYQLALSKRDSVKDALIEAVGQWGWPTSFAVLTTGAALLSFLSIGLIPLNWLGLTSASLILVVLINIFVLTIILLSFDKKAKKKIETNRVGLFDKIVKSVSQLLINHQKKVAVTFAMLAVIIAVGLSNFEVNFDTEHSYGNKVSYINRMTEVASTKIGTFDSYNVTIRFPEKDAIKKIDVLKKFEEFQNEVMKLKLTKKTSSILTILKDMNKLMNGDNPNAYQLPQNSKQVAQLLMLYEMSGGSKLSDWTNPDFNILRLRIGLKTMDSKESIAETKFLRKLSAQLFPDAKINVTGSLPSLAEVNHLIAVGQIKSLIIALLVISIMMMLAFGSIRLGLIGLIPNIFPLIIVGGTMGFFDIPIDFLTVTVAPMILGIAVDDTIHFFNHVKQHYKKSANYKIAVTEAIKTLGKAIITTSVVIALAFSVYLISSFNIMRNLGLLVVIGILSALFADLLLSPLLIILTKPFGDKGNNNKS